MQQENKYTIKQVASKTGLSPQLIRKWEERYHVVTPQRLQNGYRVYSEGDIRRLLSTHKWIERGFTASQAVQQALREFNADGIPALQESSDDWQRTYINELLLAGDASDANRISHVLRNVIHIRGLEVVVRDIVIPFMLEVGNRWETHDWTEAQEHLASLAIRDTLVELGNRLEIPANAPLLLGSCLPGERHELPVQILLLRAGFRGWKTISLGPSPAPTAIADAAQRLQPDAVVLSASTDAAFQQYPNLAKELDAFAASVQHIPVYLGGPGAKTVNYPFRYIQYTENVEEVLALPQ